MTRIVNTQDWRNAGLVAWWKQTQQHRGGELHDNTNRSNKGKLTNAASSVWEGPRGLKGSHGVLHLDGSNDYVAVDHTEVLNLDRYTDKMSIAAWFNTDALTPGAAQIIIAKPVADGTHSSPYFAYSLHIMDTYSALRFWMASSTGSEWDFVRVDDVITAGKWHHGVGTYDGANMRLYLDGKQIGSPTARTGAIWTAATQLRLGANGAADANEMFDGRIDDVRLYERVLLVREINELYLESRRDYRTALPSSAFDWY